MASSRLRTKAKVSVSYAESDGSVSPQPQTPHIPFSSEDEDEIDSEEDKLARPQVQLSTPSAHGMQTRHPRQPPRPAQKARKTTKTKAGRRGRPALKASHQPHDNYLNDIALTPVVSDRRAVRDAIQNVTAAKRDRFFVENKNYFLPLLPEGNHISKLAAHMEAVADGESAADAPSVVPYEQIKAQPQGIVATMKPYQLSGLSFLVYLYRNGLSGILGDEMGLGKTLQTLSLVQYLKENAPAGNRESRPFLIVCPLSVLSSWMAESKKWAPGLKVLRFHGPVKERDRLKKIALGELDQYGNETRKQKNKLNARRRAAGKSLSDLDDEDGVPDDEAGVDIVVTTYESYVAEQNWFKRAFVWRYVVLDEGHKIKNDLSLISKALQGLQAEYRLILTGTPLQNNLSELWALLHWLYPEVFTANTSELFKKSFDLGKGLFSNAVLDNARTLLELIMLRRMKDSAGVDLNLPPKTEVLLYVPLSPMQRFWYTRLVTRMDKGLLDDLFKNVKEKEIEELATSRDDTEFLNLEKDNGLPKSLDNAVSSDRRSSLNATASSPSADAFDETRSILQSTIAREAQTDSTAPTSAWRKLMNLLMQLRKVCNHPFQIPNAEPDPYWLGEHIVTASGKFIVLDKLIGELVIKQRKKILIFSGFTRMLDLVEDLLHLRGGDGTAFRYARLDGSTPRARRNLGIRMFNKEDSEQRVMLISTRAGGLGINLASASDVVLLDQDWNPQITLQAESRAHRIGQKNPVTVYKLVSQGTVEEQMMGRIMKKLYLSAKVTESMEDIHTPAGEAKRKKGRRPAIEEDAPQLSTSQLMTLVRRGTQAISRPEIDVKEMLSWDWTTTIANCKDQPADLVVRNDTVLQAEAIDADAERTWLSSLEKVESAIFEGKKLARGSKSFTSTSDIAQDWKEMTRADRRVGKNTTVLVDGFAINKNSMACGEWEAVPTMAGKDPRLSEPKRAKREPIVNQEHCQVCYDGGELHLCQLCPRSYHMGCLDKDFQSKAQGWHGLICPQHECADCEQKTGEAGGMLYRCRWCERAYCEDDFDFDAGVLLGETLKEYDILGYGEMQQAYYVVCHGCKGLADKQYMQEMERVVDEEYTLWLGRDETTEATTSAPTTHTASTVSTSGVTTPMSMVAGGSEMNKTPLQMEDEKWPWADEMLSDRGGEDAVSLERLDGWNGVQSSTSSKRKRAMDADVAVTGRRKRGVKREACVGL